MQAEGRGWGCMHVRSAVERQAGDWLGGGGGGWWAREGRTHHRPHVSRFSLLPRGSRQALCRKRSRHR